MSTEGEGGDLEIVHVDGRDTDLLARWQTTYETAERHGHPFATPWNAREVRATVTAPVPRFGHELLAGVLAGDVVSCGWITFPRLDNLTQAYVQVYVDPAHRGRGHGTRMLAEVEERCRRAERSVLLAEVVSPLELPEDGAGHPDADWARRRGYACALSDVGRVLALPVPPDRLVNEVAPPYEVRTFAGAVPEDLLEGFVELSASLATEAPMGDLEMEKESADVAAYREDEAQLTLQGRRRWGAVAMLDEEVVGYTDIVVSADDDAFQWGTLVRTDHRGHGLGMALKSANLQRLQVDRPDLRLVHTWNASDNTHMVAVNEALGYRPVDRLAEFQKHL